MTESSLAELGKEAKKASLLRFEQLFADIRLHKNFTEEKGIGPSFDMDLLQKELQPLIDIVKSGELFFEDLPEDIQYILGEWDLSELFPQKKTLKEKKNNADEDGEDVGDAPQELSPADREKRQRHVPSTLSLEGFSSFFTLDELRPIREIIGRVRALNEDRDDVSTQISPKYIFSIVEAMIRVGVSYKDMPTEFTKALSTLHIEKEFLDLLKEKSKNSSRDSLGAKLSKFSDIDKFRFLRIAHDFLLVGITGIVYRSGQHLRITPEDMQFFKDCMKDGEITFEDFGPRLNFTLRKQGLKNLLED